MRFKQQKCHSFCISNQRFKVIQGENPWMHNSLRPGEELQELLEISS